MTQIYTDPLKEIERLRAELDAAKAQLESVAHALLATEMTVTGEDGSPVTIPPNVVAKAKLVIHERAELRRKLTESKAKHDEAEKVSIKYLQLYEQSKANEARLTQENARLAAALALVVESHEHGTDHGPTFADGYRAAKRALQGDSTALRELLGPTVELLKRVVEFQSRYAEPHERELRKELTRLREAMGGRYE